MSKYTLVLGMLFCVGGLPNAAEGGTLIDSTKVLVNTIGATDIRLRLYLKEVLNIKKSEDSIDTHDVTFILVRYADNSPIGMPEAKPTIGAIGTFVDFMIPLQDEELMRLVVSGQVPVYIALNRTLTLEADNGNLIELSKAYIKETSHDGFALTERQKEMLKDASGNQTHLYMNRFDITRQIGETDSMEAEYVIDFDYFRSLPIELGEDGHLMLQFKGTISTAESNPLNRMKAFVNWRIPKNELFELQLGAAGNQQLTAGSIRFNAQLQGLMPNLVDLTNGASRLRLKPYFKGGVSVVANLDDQNPYQDRKTHLQIFVEGYYYIPVAHKFAIIIQSEAFYGKGLVEGDNIRSNYSMKFGYDLPLEDLKVLATIQNGENDVNFGRANRVLVGVLLDYIPF